MHARWLLLQPAVVAFLCVNNNNGRRRSTSLIIRARRREESEDASLAAQVERVEKRFADALHRAGVVAAACGCWAGRVYTFSPAGQVEPIDDCYLDEALREWGSPPLSTQILSKDEKLGNLWKRTTLSVDHESGCAADEVAVELRSWGLDMMDAMAWSSTRLSIADSLRYPSGEAGPLSAAPPYVEARTLTYDDKQRVRLDLRLDPSRSAILACSCAWENRIDCDDSPFAPSSKLFRRMGSRRLEGFDASRVDSLCGPCLAERAAKKNSSEPAESVFGADGSTRFALLDDTIHIHLLPLDDDSSQDLDAYDGGRPVPKARLRVSIAGFATVSRDYDALGNLLDIRVDDDVNRLAAAPPPES